MDNFPFCDKRIVTALLGSDLKERNSSILYLYNTCYPSVEAFILKNNGLPEDAADIFQEAIAALNEKVIEYQFKGQSALKTYLIGIAKNLWYKELRNVHAFARRTTTLYEHSLETQLQDQEAESEINHEKWVNTVIHQLCGECKEIIMDYYFKNLSMKDIKIKYKLGSEQAAKNKKYRCLKKLSTLLKKNQV